MSTPTRADFTSADGTTIAAYRWEPEGAPKAIAQITHGMGEHAQRYGRLADALTADGYVVHAQDHRGHGETAESLETQGQIGAEGWTELVADIGRLGDSARAAYPGIPLVLIGHSMGSFAAQQYVLDHSDQITALVLTGTAAIDLLEPALDLDQPIDLFGFNAPFAPARTDYDWLSRDEAEVDAYVADPRCGFGLDAEAGKAMFAGSHAVAQKHRIANMRRHLPVFVGVGEHDPVHGELALVQALVDRYRDAGLEDVTLRVYPGARHEVFNETNRDEVVAEIVAWLDARLAATG